MDIQSKVAPRRAELDRQAKNAEAEARRNAEKAEAEERRIEREIEEAKAKQRADALETIAADLSNDKVEVVRDGETLALREKKIAPLDAEGLKQSEIIRLFNHEARKLWTPRQNWWVIGTVSSGISALLMTFTALAFGLPAFFLLLALTVLAVLGYRKSTILNSQYRGQLRQQYPDLFGDLPEPKTIFD